MTLPSRSALTAYLGVGAVDEDVRLRDLHVLVVRLLVVLLDAGADRASRRAAPRRRKSTTDGPGSAGAFACGRFILARGFAMSSAIAFASGRRAACYDETRLPRAHAADRPRPLRHRAPLTRSRARSGGRSAASTAGRSSASCRRRAAGPAASCKAISLGPARRLRHPSARCCARSGGPATGSATNMFLYAYDWRQRVVDDGAAAGRRDSPPGRGLGRPHRSAGPLERRPHAARGVRRRPRAARRARRALGAARSRARSRRSPCCTPASSSRRSAAPSRPRSSSPVPGSMDSIPSPATAAFLDADGGDDARSLRPRDVAPAAPVGVPRRSRSRRLGRGRRASASPTCARPGSFLEGAAVPKHLVCICGDGLPTQRRIVVEGGRVRLPGEGNLRGLPAEAIVEGDGTVTLESARSWAGARPARDQDPRAPPPRRRPRAAGVRGDPRRPAGLRVQPSSRRTAAAGRDPLVRASPRRAPRRARRDLADEDRRPGRRARRRRRGASRRPWPRRPAEDAHEPLPADERVLAGEGPEEVVLHRFERSGGFRGEHASTIGPPIPARQKNADFARCPTGGPCGRARRRHLLERGCATPSARSAPFSRPTRTRRSRPSGCRAARGPPSSCTGSRCASSSSGRTTSARSRRPPSPSRRRCRSCP